MSGLARSTSDQERIAAIRSGDATAFEALFREFYEGLCGFVFQITKSEAIAEEVVQDVLLRVWEQRVALDVRGTLAGYLYGAVRNRAITHARRARLERGWRERVIAERASPFAGSLPPADAQVRSAELAEAITRAIEELPPRCREAYRLRREQHLSYSAISEVMGISVKTVEVHIGAALKALRHGLADWWD